ncbi:hypothetical protein FACS189475_03920 [Betaproteobacteria bacterium]|nr:hypothetical protein FACS189475_03920 [Betaproteobacteria bacterium]
MKSTRISALPIIPEQYGGLPHDYDNIPNFLNQMTIDERRFVSGLIRYYEPDMLLEIGVFRGEGTINILSAIADMDSKLVSIDKLEKFSFEGNVAYQVGTVAMDVYANTLNDKWHLLTGKDPSEVMEELNRMFDFVMIDTAHLHPVESMNFLSVLPWLNDGAIVVMHDISNYLNNYDGAYAHCEEYAPRLLMSAVCAEKIEPTGVSFSGFPNIVAFQVTQDTRKYIQNVFDVLMMPWAIYPINDVKNVHKLVKKYYTGKQIAAFEMASKLNEGIHLPTISWTELKSDTVFYGAGQEMRKLLCQINAHGLFFDFTLWDINAGKIANMDEHPVTVPDFETCANPGQKMVVMIANRLEVNRICRQFRVLGFEVFHGVEL